MDKKLLMAPIERKMGFDKYCEIVMLAKATDDLTKCEYFQRLFNGYYVVRRDPDWRDSFYSVFQEVKTGIIKCCFDDIIDAIFEKTNGRVEASFSSKLLSVFDDSMPIIDSNVIKNTNLPIKGNSPQTKLENAKKVYQTLCDRYTEYYKNCEKVLSFFDSLFPNYADKLSRTKKIDYFLWSFTRKELEQSGLFGGLI